jgi:hypothetical protein
MTTPFTALTLPERRALLKSAADEAAARHEARGRPTLMQYCVEEWCALHADPSPFGERAETEETTDAV